MDGTRSLTPALGFHMLTPLYGRVVALTTRERIFKRALLDQAPIELGRQVLDVGCGCDTTSDNAAGMLPVLFASAGFRQVEETRRIPTALSIVSPYRAIKGGAAPGRRSAGGTA